MKYQESFVVVILVSYSSRDSPYGLLQKQVFCQDCILLGISAVHGRVMSLRLVPGTENYGYVLYKNLALGIVDCVSVIMQMSMLMSISSLGI